MSLDICGIQTQTLPRNIATPRQLDSCILSHNIISYYVEIVKLKSSMGKADKEEDFMKTNEGQNSQNPSNKKEGEVNYATKFTTRKGNTFYASDYGHKAWPIGSKKK